MTLQCLLMTTSGHQCSGCYLHSECGVLSFPVQIWKLRLREVKCLPCGLLVSHRPSGWGRKGEVPCGPGCLSSSPRFAAQLTWTHVCSPSTSSSVLGTPRALDTRCPCPQASGEGGLERVGASLGVRAQTRKHQTQQPLLEKVGSGRRWRPCTGDTQVGQRLGVPTELFADHFRCTSLSGLPCGGGGDTRRTSRP